MKKLNVLICVLLMIFSLSACSNIDNEDLTTTEPITVLTTVPTSTIIPEGSSVITSEATAITETTATTTTEVTTSVITTESTTAYTTTEATTTEATTKPTITTATSTSTTTTEKPATTKPNTAKPVTTKPTTAKFATTKPTTTKPATTVPTTQTTTEIKKYCTVKIECNTIYDNIGKLKIGKNAFLPTNGIILNNVQVELEGGESAFDVIKKACEENVCTDKCKYCKASGVQIEYTYTPAFNNYYIEGIHQIYEKDCGTQSGWMYSVNGVFPDVGSSSYTVSPDDVIMFSFTCNMGEDIGNTY